MMIITLIPCSQFVQVVVDVSRRPLSPLQARALKHVRYLSFTHTTTEYVCEDTGRIVITLHEAGPRIYEQTLRDLQILASTGSGVSIVQGKCDWLNASDVGLPTKPGQVSTVTLIASMYAEDKKEIVGTVRLKQVQMYPHIPLSETQVNVQFKGLTPGEHALHVHEWGDISGGCMTAGPHWNPDGCIHGGREDCKGCRHVGDLGNIVADRDGNSDTTFMVADMPLVGRRGVIGRAMVLHSKPDDLGRGAQQDSLTTGNAGGRMACGVLGLAK